MVAKAKEINLRKRVGRPPNYGSQAWLLENQEPNVKQANSNLKPKTSIKILGVSNETNKRKLEQSKPNK